MKANFLPYAARKAPFTLFLMASLVATFLLYWMAMAPGIDALALSSKAAFAQPWRLLLYPWASPAGGLLGMVFFLMWIWWVGEPTEAAMGSRRFGAYWFAATALIGLAVAVGGSLVGVDALLAGPWAPEAAVTVLWCARNRFAQIRLWCVLPVTGTQLAALTAAALVLALGFQNPIVGLLAGLPLLLAWNFGRGGLPIAVEEGARRGKTAVRGATMYDEGYFENVKQREIDREEKERLRKLFEGK